MAQNQTMPVIKGALLTTDPLVIPVPKDMQIPGSITLKSADAGRLIELSTDGVEYFTPAVDVQSATMQILVVNAPITHIRLTGAANDIYLVS
jgi:hypothetical protein